MSENPLGKPTQYIDKYSPELLFAIARKDKRSELNSRYLDFKGQDIWNAFEISWLNLNGLPRVAIAEIRVDCDSTNIIESKSLKLYLNSFNQTKIESIKKLEFQLTRDLSQVTMSQVYVKLYSPQEFVQFQISEFKSDNIDNESVVIQSYDYQADILKQSAKGKVVKESLSSHLLKSNCLITSQPDWASLMINYEGPQIERGQLLKYLISFRHHNEFHEQCVERIYADIKQYCQPDKLTVYARYTRRGGLDINPWRSNFETKMPNIRLARQ